MSRAFYRNRYALGDIPQMDVRKYKEPVAYGVWGVEIDYTNSNPETSVIYTDDAIGMTGGSFDWDNTPLFSGIKPCLLKDGKVEYYLNPNDYTKKLDGTSADITSGNDGDVMIEIPKLGYKMETIGNTLKIQVTNDPNKGADGFRYYAHTRDTEGDRDFLYVSAYKGYTGSYGGSTKLRSLSGKSPTVSTTMVNFRTYANNNGSGYDMLSFYPLTLLQILFIIRYKNLNSQVALGHGWVKQSVKTNTGGLNASGMYWGGTDKQQVKFMGIEDMWGNVYDYIDGLYSDGSRNIKTAFKNFNNNGTNYANHGQGSGSNISGNVKTVQGDNNRGFIIKTSGGDYNKDSFCDFGLLYSSSLPYFGGHWNDGANAGMFSLRVHYDGPADSSRGGRVMYL